MTTISDGDVANTENTPLSEADAGEALLSLFADKTDAPKPSVEDEDEDDTTTADADGDEGSEETPDELDADDDAGDEENETAEDKPSEKKYIDDDGHYVKIKVGEEEKEVSVKDLKRLFGQEVSLTHKSVEVANARKTAEADAQKYVTSLNVLLTRATEKANPYRNIDWMAVSKDPTISAEAASALRADAQRALDDESFLGQNLNAFMGDVQKKQNEDRATSAKACITALTTAPTEAAPNANFIKGWSDKTYTDIRAFAIKQGMPEAIVNGTTDPAAIKMMHMAMLFKKGSAKVVTTKAVNKTPQKIVKTSSSPAARATKTTVEKASAMKNLKNSGSVDAAGDAFLATFAD